MRRALSAVDDCNPSFASLNYAAPSAAGVSVSVVIPTFNEARNVRPLIDKLTHALARYEWEVIFVDDNSSDMTWKTVKEIAQRDARVRCLRRVNRRGLSGACIEGILSSAAPVVVVMDGDLQHDEAVIPRMIEMIKHKNADLVVGSRYVAGGSCGSGFSNNRALASRLATLLAHKAVATDVKDIMSGFFALRRDAFESIAGRLATSGFKILMDILMTAGSSLRVAEVEYEFRKREDGASKFDMQAIWDFVGVLANKATRGVLPVRFVQFVFVGGIGIFVHLLALGIGLQVVKSGFSSSQIGATSVAMTSNFFINNLSTYRDKKLKGLSLIKGLLFFYLVCSAGVLSNIGIAAWLFGQHNVWWVAGLAGAMIGAVWNYTVSSALVWRR
ncbi:MAG: glycosyltransferase family 2 protein [Alphaproteobacteria bacterium]|nr:glycosyltransferase family 2 protein [Alphaproteobacteria bacterium]